MTAVIFKDKEIQARFDKDGYVVIDFISAEEAKNIAEVFYEMYKNIPEGFYSVAENPDGDLKKTIDAHIEKILAPKIDTLFQNYKKLGSTFLCKTPGEKGKVPVHQDWMVVDETKYFSATVWIPTIDTNETNGAMRVLPGSHKFFHNIRSSTLPMPYEACQQQLWENMITIPMKAGQAFIHNHAVIHSSTLNTTDKERLSVVYAVIPEQAKLMFYHKNETGRVEKYDMPDDMFLRYFNLGERPAFGKKADEFNYTTPATNQQEIEELITAARKERNIKPFYNTVTKPVFITPVASEITGGNKGEATEETTPAENIKTTDTRPFLQKYTLPNIVREIKNRILVR